MPITQLASHWIETIMTKHTQGQWVQYGTSVRAADNDATIASVQANYGESHATFGSVDEINYSEQVANARLIAAAPELLEAAQEMADLLENLLRIDAINPNLIIAESIRNVLPIHRAAIVKATQS